MNSTYREPEIKTHPLQGEARLGLIGKNSYMENVASIERTLAKAVKSIALLSSREKRLEEMAKTLLAHRAEMEPILLAHEQLKSSVASLVKTETILRNQVSTLKSTTKVSPAFLKKFQAPIDRMNEQLTASLAALNGYENGLQQLLQVDSSNLLAKYVREQRQSLERIATLRTQMLASASKTSALTNALGSQ